MDLLLDTSVISYFLRRPPSDPLRQRYWRHIPGNNTFISFQSIGELWSLAERNQWGAGARMELELAILPFVVLHSDDDLCRRWATISSACARAGRRLEAGDAWILATASLYELPLLTHDRDFLDLPLPGVTVICYA